VNRDASRQLLALALLLPALACADTPWDCIRQANGKWICNSKLPPPPPELPATDSSQEGTPEPGEIPAADSIPAEPTEPAAATGTSTAGKDSTLPDTGATVAEEPAAGAQVPGGDQDSTTATEVQEPRAVAEQSDAQARQAAAPAIVPAAVEQADSDRWALCPPVDRPAPLQQGIDADTINLQADNAQASENNVYTLEGNAVVQYAGQRLEAENIVYRQDSGEVEALQGIRYTGPELYVSGESAALYPELQQGELRDVDYILYEQHGRGEAQALRLDSLTEQSLEGAYYTTCPPGNEDWLLSARKVELDEAQGTGTARGAKLSFKGVPIMYTPYASFPIDDRRKSGLLVPKVGQTEQTGFDASLPVYWNIAPNRDMTIIPRYMSDRGTMLGAEFRYLNAHNNGRLSGEYLPSDNKSDNEDRSLVAITHHGNPWPRLQTSIIASNVSDENYFEDLGTNLVETSQTNLDRSAAMDYHGIGWQLGMRVQDFQTIDATVTSAERPYKQLPQIVFSATPDTRLLGMKFETGAEFNHFTHSDADVVKGSRLDVLPTLSLPVYRAGWYIDPSVGIRYTAYDLYNTTAGTDDKPSRTTPVVSLDTGTFFERNGRWGDSDYVQTLEPRLFYLYVPYRNQEDLPVFDTGDYDFNYWTLFRENRFSGPDRMGDANQLALALTSRFLNPANGVELFSVRVGTLLYFRDREVTLPGEPVETSNTSNIIGELTLGLTHEWNARAETQWNPQASQSDLNSIHLQYHKGHRQLVNLSYRYRRGIEDQTDISALWPLGNAWHMVGRWYYSLRDNQTLEVLGGLGYESCCWTAQLVGRSFVKNLDTREKAIFLQVELRGLGRLVDTVDKALERGILGYDSLD
jgi:LPS-assembly protein